MKLALDTNTYRALCDGDESAVRIVERADRVLLPVPVVAELRFGFLNGTRGRANEAQLIRFMDEHEVRVMACDEDTAIP